MSSEETNKQEEAPTTSAITPVTQEHHIIKSVVHRPVGVPRSILTMGDDELARLSRLAEMLESSSLAFKKDGSSRLTKGDIFLIFAKGVEVGFEPMAALDSISIIAGKPTLDPAGMLALINGNGLLEDMQIVEKSAERSVIMMKRVGRSPVTHEFTMEDARRIKAKENQKDITLAEKTNYKQQPAVMLQWRNVGAMCRLIFPDALKGLKYTPEEMGADVEVDEGGNMIVIESPARPVQKSEPAPRPAEQQPAPQPTAQQPAPQQSKPTSQIKTAGETWLKNEKTRKALEDLLRELGYKAADKEKWLSQVHPGQALATFGASTFTKTELFARLKEIAPTINPAQPKGQQQPEPQPEPAPRKPGDGLANPVVVDYVRYVDAGAKAKYLQFETQDGDFIRAYGRSTTFKKQVGQEFYDANGFEDMEPNTDEAYEIDSLQISWELKTPDTGNMYLLAKTCTPLVPDEDADAYGSELDDFLNDEDFTANKQAALEGVI